MSTAASSRGPEPPAGTPSPTQLVTSPSSELRLYTVVEACQILRISRWSLYQLMNRGELHSMTIGSRRLVPVADLEAFVEARRREPAS